MSNIILGTEFDDEIGGLPGEDVIYAGDGNDKIYSGVHGGQDIIYGENGNDRIRGAGQIYGGEGNDIIAGSGLIHGGNGNDLIDASGEVHGDEGDDRLRVSGVAFGGAGNDVIFVDGEAHGGEGNDQIKGQGTLYGDAGDDVFYVSISPVRDLHYTALPEVKLTINAGSGVDTLVLNNASDPYYVRELSDLKIYFKGVDYAIRVLDYYFDNGEGQVSKLEKIALEGKPAVDLIDTNTVSGGESSDFLQGFRHPSFGNDTIYGNGGNDQIKGWGGDDFIDGGSGDDTIRGGTGYNTIFGGEGNDVISSFDGEIHGGDGNDNLVGGEFIYGDAGNDRLVASSGDFNSLINGGEGNDLLRGGAGTDTFVFDTLNGYDRISDFGNGGDKLDISALMTGFDPLQDAISNFVRFVESGSHTVMRFDNDGLGSERPVTLAIIAGTMGLDAASLYLDGRLIVTSET